eukprot:TRINITY_DN26432_c0_g1_i8.p1 TRINITY_DN26432_c0_g1~~TRINITY_DN26432_c0_g1_i8.p1  ORF type:complete len:1050 (-),score=169.06 TRINITY_DN26432_c0_g1_i8:69-3218(-)
MENLFTDAAPEEFLDPVTMVLMRDPVVLPSGETYERETILRNRLKDPQTRQQLVEGQLTSNRALRRQIDKYLKGCVESRIDDVQKAGKDGWDKFQELLCALVDDCSDPALFAQTRLLDFLRDKSFSSALLSRTFEQQKLVVSAMLQIRSTLVKECLFTLLCSYAVGPQEDGRARPKRVKRAASSRGSPPEAAKAPVIPPIKADQETIDKLGLAALFRSHDSSEVELASNFAILFMAEPFARNVLDFLGTTEASVEALDAVLKSNLCDSKPEVTKELVLSLGAWSSSNGAVLAAQQFSTVDKLQQLLNVLFQPECPEGADLERVLSPLLRNTVGWQKEAKLLLCVNSRALLDRVAKEILGDSPESEWLDLLVSLMHIGVTIQDVLHTKSKTSGTVSPSSFVLVIHKLSLSIASGSSVDLLTRQVVGVFAGLCSCKLSSSFLSSNKMVRCANIIKSSTMGSISGAGTADLLNATITLAERCAEAKKSDMAWDMLCFAQQVAVNVGSQSGVDNCMHLLEKLAYLWGAYLVEPKFNSDAQRQKDCMTALAVLNQRHGSINMESVIGAQDPNLKLAICQAQLKLVQMQLGLQPSASVDARNQTDAHWDVAKCIPTVLVLLRAGLYVECYTPANEIFKQIAEAEPGQVNDVIGYLCTWATTATTWNSISQALRLLQRVAVGQTGNEVRQFLIDNTAAVKIIFDVLGSGDCVFSEPSPDLSYAQLEAVKLLDALLGEKTQACGMTLPPDVVRRQLVQKLTVLMKQSLNDQELHRASCSCLFKVTARCREVEYSADQLELLAASVDRFMDATSIHADVFGIQMYLSTRRRYKKQLSNLSHVHRCLKAIETEMAPLQIIKPACGVLRNAARNVTEDNPGQEQLQGFPWLRVVNTATRIMKSYPNDSEVQYRSCGILVNVATCTHGASVTKEDLRTALELVLKAMELHPNHSELHMWSLHFFLQYQTNHAPITLVGNQVLKTLRFHKGNSELQLLGISVAQKLVMGQQPKSLNNTQWIDGVLDAIYECLSLIHISEPTRLLSISYAVFCLKKKKKNYLK